MVKPIVSIKEEISVQWVERSCFMKKCYSNLVISCTFKEKMLWAFDIFSTGADGYCIGQGLSRYSRFVVWREVLINNAFHIEIYEYYKFYGDFSKFYV